MKEIKNIQLSIICPESWEAMRPVTQGRHCAKCNRKVIDLTNSTAAGLEEVKTENPNGFCGRFRLSQTIYSRAAAMLLLTAGLTFSANLVKAQPPAVADTAKIKAVGKEPIVFGMIEQMPVYKYGGEAGMLKFLAANIKIDEELDIYGTVYVNFTIDTLGKVTNASILRGINSAVDAEAIRVVKLLEYIPGTQNGRKVNVQYNIPIRFINNNDEK
jgi:protein TonB